MQKIPKWVSMNNQMCFLAWLGIRNMRLYFGVEFQSRVLNHRWFSSLSYANTSHLWNVWRNLVMRNSEWWELLKYLFCMVMCANLFCNSNLFYKYIPLIWVQSFRDYERTSLFIKIHLGKLYDYICRIHWILWM
jgi:hypothetical protein